MPITDFSGIFEVAAFVARSSEGRPAPDQGHQVLHNPVYKKASTAFGSVRSSPRYEIKTNEKSLFFSKEKIASCDGFEVLPYRKLRAELLRTGSDRRLEESATK
jgi:hypothetical protein